MKNEVAGFFKTDGDAERLHCAENHRYVSSPLGNFLPSQLAFFLQFGQRLIHDGQKLQDDRRRDVRHDAQSENGQASQVAAGEQINETEQRTPILIEEVFQFEEVHTWGRKMAAQPVNRQHGQRKQNPLAQVGDTEDVRQLLKHYCKTSTLPPALVIFSCADLENLWACTVMATVSSPSPRIFTGCFALITPALRRTSGVIGEACSSSPSAASRSRLTILNSLRKIF